ncbi:hypothetical protein IP84_04075 [beta proteobacterium AAP99]|nr:hypothetical protein IP84_04075 [beta proteobacterium AAP99]
MSTLKAKQPILWLPEPEEHDYPAAQSFLSLLLADHHALAAVSSLRAAPMSQFKAKDIFRASGLSTLGVSNGHVAKDLDKIDAGKPLSPLLLMRDSAHGRVVVADGYHRLCAVYERDEDALIPCKIV